MNIDKAIEILDQDLKEESELSGNEFSQAVKLGIEALDRCNVIRKYTDPKTYQGLPSETED